jgi:hypothetical protein
MYSDNRWNLATAGRVYPSSKRYAYVESLVRKGTLETLAARVLGVPLAKPQAYKSLAR